MREGRVLIEARVFHTLPGNGRIIHSPFARDYRFSPLGNRGSTKAAWIFTLERKLANVRILLAGPLAEAKKLGKPLRAIGAASDLAACRNIASSLGHLNEFIYHQAGVGILDPHELLNEQRNRVKRWLARRVIWAAIDRIALELEEKGEIGSGAILRAYLEARNERQRTLALDWTRPKNG